MKIHIEFDGMIAIKAQSKKEEKELRSLWEKAHLHFCVKAMYRKKRTKFTRIILAPSILEWKKGDKIKR